jgi:hypothetical protein
MKDPNIGSYVFKSSASVEVECFGKVISGDGFISDKLSPYPVGYRIKRTLLRPLEGLPQDYFFCEIEAIGLRPLFVVSTGEVDFIGSNTLEAWILMLTHWVSYEVATDFVKRMKSSGDYLFGLTRPNVVDKLQAIGRSAGIKFSGEESPTEDTVDEDFTPHYN